MGAAMHEAGGLPGRGVQACVGWGARAAQGELTAIDSAELLDGSESTSFDRSATPSFSTFVKHPSGIRHGAWCAGVTAVEHGRC